MQVGVARGLMIGAGHNLEVSRHAGDAREVGNVAGWSGLSQDGCDIDAIEQAHAKDFAGTYPNCGCDAGPIAVVTVDEAKSVAILTDFELDRLNPAIHAGHLRRIFKNRRRRAAPRWRPRHRRCRRTRRWPDNQRKQQAGGDRARHLSHDVGHDLASWCRACRALPRSSPSCPGGSTNTIVITSFEALPTGGRPHPELSFSVFGRECFGDTASLVAVLRSSQSGGDPFEEVILSKGQAARRSWVTVSSLHLKFHHGFERMRLKRLVRCT